MKNDIRKYAKACRMKLDIKALSRKIHANLFSLDEWKKVKNIFTYYSVDSEVNTTDLFIQDKNWYIPRISGKELLVCPYKENMLELNKYNIPESTLEEVSADTIDMIIIPALAADKNGYRIGYGGGYYDRFIPKLKNDALKVVFVYSDLLYNELPHDHFDQKCDIVITDKEIYKINC